MPEKSEAIGVDLGGTKIEIGRVDAAGNILKNIRLVTDTVGGPQGIEKQIIDAIQELKAVSDVPLAGIGVGVAGQVDEKTGMVYFAPNLPKWRNVPLQLDIEEAIKLPVKIINDVRAITLGEWLFGAGKNLDNLVCVFVGTGIGGGIISGGKLLKGYTNTFGEIGHMTIDFFGPVCTCGNRGCWESIAGGWGIAKYTQDLVNADRYHAANLLKLADGNVLEISAKTVVDAYRLDDPMAKLILERVKTALIAGCVSLVNLYNPQRMILGGGFLDGMPEFTPIIEQGIRQYALKAATQCFEAVPAKLGRQAGVIGAAAAVLENVIKFTSNN